MKRILSEPLVHFIVLGAAIFALSQYRQSHRTRDTILVTQARVRALAENYRLQYGVQPTVAQRDALLERAIDEEIQYREAVQLHLDADDEIIRRRLVQKYEFLTQDLAGPPEPTDAQLLTYYRQNLTRYQSPERVTFTHVYFSADRIGETGAREAAQKWAARLNEIGVTRAQDRGDRFPGPYDLAAVTAPELQRVFGQEGLAQAVLTVEPGRWSAPMRSGFGWHTVYVYARVPQTQAPFAEAREAVRRDYLETEQTQRNTRALAEVRSHFKIIHEAVPGAS